MPEPTTEIQLSEVLSDFARTMLTDFRIQAILDLLVERIVAMLPITAAGVTLISPTLSPRYVSASDESALRYEKLQTELGEGPCLLAFHSDAAVAVPDLRLEDRFPLFTPQALEAGMNAVFTFPLRHDNHRLGALDLYRDTAGELTGSELTTAQTLADVAAAYLISAQARADLQDTSDRSLNLALHDGLTGLPNRALMLERLHHAFQRSARTGTISAVLYVDLDGFKSVNDCYGHATGDRLLVAVAARLAGALRPPDTLARLHGDEFVILCEDLRFPDDAAIIVKRLQNALASPYQIDGEYVSMTASVGMAFADPHLHDPEQALRDADAAMYRAKRAGGSHIQVFDPRYRHLTNGHNALELDLVGALDRGELRNEYQAIDDTRDAHIAGFETLVRWIHPTRGSLPPTVFIPIAEKSPLINQIGRWVLEQALTDLNRLQTRQGEDDPKLRIAVNVSPRQLTATGFVDSVADVLQTYGTRPSLLTLEITENVFVHDSARALTVLRNLKELGVELALDDFGTGYSSLSYLNQFPVDVVKIDRSFITNLDAGSVSRIITAAVVELAHSLNMTVIAEGVETAHQHQQVRALNCDFSQGFFFAKPMTINHIRNLLQTPVTRSAGSL